jgi:hypothetical protein
MFCFVLMECVERRAVVRRTGLATLTRRLARIPWLYTAAQSKREGRPCAAAEHEAGGGCMVFVVEARNIRASRWGRVLDDASCCSIEVSLCEARLAQHDTVRKSKIMHAYYAVGR